MIDQFFSGPLDVIASTLPDLWKQIKEQIQDDVEDILDKPENVTENLNRNGYLVTNFRLDHFLGGIEADLIITFKQMKATA